MSRRAWLQLRAPLIGIPICANLLAVFASPGGFWEQFLPSLYYVSIVVGGLTLGWKAGLSLALVAGISYSLIGHFLLATPIVRLTAQLISFLIVGFVLAEKRKRATDQLTQDRLKPGTAGLASAVAVEQISTMAGEILREIRTPIASIEGAAFILSDTNENNHSGEFLAIIQRECERLKRTLVEISECTEVLPLRCEPTDVSSLLAEVVRSSALEHPDPDIALQTEVIPSLPPVWCDVTRVRQAIVPFVTSAMDSMLGGGRILLVADQVDSHCRIQLKILEQTVRASDPGSGRGPYSSTFDATGGHRIMAAWRTVMQHGGTIRIEEGGQIRKLQFLTLPLYNGQVA